MNFSIRVPLFSILILCCAHVWAADLCEKNESTVFACDLAAKDKIAVCSGEKKGQRYLEYRYGIRSSVEMRFRADDSDPQKKFHLAEVLYASNASDILWFQYQGLFYLIHFPMRGGPVQSVIQDGKTIRRQACRGGWGGVRGHLKNAKEFLIDHGSEDADTIERYWGGK